MVVAIPIGPCTLYGDLPSKQQVHRNRLVRKHWQQARVKGKQEVVKVIRGKEKEAKARKEGVRSAGATCVPMGAKHRARCI